jgi:hypothetical protein
MTTLADARAGDLVFFDSPGAVSWLIRVAQRIRWHGRWNHVAWLDHQDDTGTWIIGQAEGSGVTVDKPLVLGPHDEIVPLPAPLERAHVLAFARAQAGKHYGFLTIASIFFTLLSPRFLNVMTAGTWVCSAVVAESLRFGGWYHDWPDIYQVAPDPLYTALTGTNPKETSMSNDLTALLSDIEHRFAHHPPATDAVAAAHTAVRSILTAAAQDAVKAAEAVAGGPSREISLALTALEEAGFWLNAHIARNQPVLDSTAVTEKAPADAPAAAPEAAPEAAPVAVPAAVPVAAPAPVAAWVPQPAEDATTTAPAVPPGITAPLDPPGSAPHA